MNEEGAVMDEQLAERKPEVVRIWIPSISILLFDGERREMRWRRANRVL